VFEVCSLAANFERSPIVNINNPPRLSGEAMGRPTELFAAGSNGRGQLATGDSHDAHTFTPCKFAGRESESSYSTLHPHPYPPAGEPPPDIISIVGGGNHTLVLLSPVDYSASSTRRFEVWGCGEGAKGQLGPAYVKEQGHDESAAMILRPLILPLEEQALFGYAISQVAACWETSFFVLTKPGQHDLLISMGGDDFGDLGIGGLRSNNSRNEARSPFHVVDFSHILGSTPHHLSITGITAGPHHAIALLRADDKQHVVGWGTSRHGQLGPLRAPSGRALPFSASPVAIELPINVQLDPVLSVRVGNQHSLFLHASGRVSALGSDAKGQLRGLQAARDVRAIDCSWNGSYLLVPCRGLLSTGANARGQLGRGDDDASEAPLGGARLPDDVHVLGFASGSEHVLAMVESQGRTDVWGWGWNEHGNLGTGSTNDVSVPVRIWPPLTVEPERMVGDVVAVWAGCGTSWICCSKAS
jgi:protein ATS1